MPRIAVIDIPYSLDFDGTADSVSMGNNFDKERTDKFGFSFKFFPRNATDLQTIFQKRDTGNEGYEMIWGNSDDAYNFVLEGSNGSRLTVTTTALPINEWHSIEVTYDGSGVAAGVKIYNKAVSLDLTIVIDTLATDITNSDNFELGIRKDNTGDLDGILTDFRIHNAERTAAQVSDGYFNNVYTDVEAYYDFSDGIGATLTDIIGGVNGTITNASWSIITPFKARKAVRDFPYSNTFNGSSDKISLTAGSDFPMYSAGAVYSLAGWVKLDSASGARAIYGEGDTATSNQEWSLFIDDITNKIRIFIQNDANATIATVTSTTALEQDRWYHITFTDNNGTARLYIDGLLDPQSFDYTPSGAVTMDTANIGITERSSDSFFFSGDLTRFVFSNTTVWTAKEVSSLYYSNTIPGSATAKYLHDEGTGTVLADSIGSNTGTIASGSAWDPNTDFKPRFAVRNIPSAAAFNGSTSLVDFGDIYDKERTDKFSFSFPFFPRDAINSQTLFQKRNIAGAGYDIQFGVPDNEIRFTLEGSNGNALIVDSNVNFILNKWYYITITYDGSSNRANL